MVRHARIVLPGVAHHVTQRGNDSRKIFFSESDRNLYLDLLRESGAREGLELLAFCLMTNHVHLVVIPEREDSLARALGRTHLMYAQHALKRRRRSGHLWQSRFYSCPLDESHEHNACAYVELNPVRAKMVKRAWQYPWSSAAAHCDRGVDPSGMLHLDSWFDAMPVETWLATLREIGRSKENVDALRSHTRTGRPLGSYGFLDWIEEEFARTIRVRPRGRPKSSRDTKRRKRRVR